MRFGAKSGPYLLSALAGTLVGIACPPTGLHYLSWLGFAIFGVVLLRERDLTPLKGALHFGCLSLPMNLLLLYWFFPTILNRAGLGVAGTILAVTLIFGTLVSISMMYGLLYGFCRRRFSSFLNGQSATGTFPRSLLLNAGFLLLFFVFWDSTEIRAFPYSPIQFSVENTTLFAAVYYLRPLGLRLLLFGFSVAGAALFVGLYRTRKSDFWKAAALAAAITWGTCWLAGTLAIRHLKTTYAATQPVALLQDNFASIRLKSAEESKGRIKPGNSDRIPTFANADDEARERKLRAEMKREAGQELKVLQDEFVEKPETWVFWSETAFNAFIPGMEKPKMLQGYPGPVDLHVVGHTLPEMSPATVGQFYNAVTLYHSKEGYLGSYLKNVLFPIGECIPFETRFPALRKLFPGWGKFIPGEEIRVIAHPDSKGPAFLVLCCYEGIFGRYGDRVAAQARNEYPGRDLIMVNPTSDAQFGLTRETIQHSTLTRFQAAKRGLPMVRPNGYGHSEIIAPWGESLRRTERDRTAVLTGLLPVKKTVLRK